MRLWRRACQRPEPRRARVGPYGPVLPVAIVSNTADAPLAAISADRMDRFAEAIRAAQSAPGATAMGWRSLRDNRSSVAVDWFRDSVAWSADHKGDLKTLEGLVLALKNAGRLPEAEGCVLRPHRRICAAARRLPQYHGGAAGHARTGRSHHDGQARSLRGAGRGRASRRGRSGDRLVPASGSRLRLWHRMVPQGRSNGSPDHRGTAKANEGYAQALQRSGERHVGRRSRLRLEFHVARHEGPLHRESWSTRSPGIIWRHGSPKPCSIAFSEVVRTEHSFSGAQALAWYRYHDAGNGYGVEWFADAVAWSPDRQADAKTIEGYASALRDVGRLGEAEDLLFPWVERVEVMRDIYIDTRRLRTHARQPAPNRCRMIGWRGSSRSRRLCDPPPPPRRSAGIATRGTNTPTRPSGSNMRWTGGRPCRRMPTASPSCRKAIVLCWRVWR